MTDIIERLRKQLSHWGEGGWVDFSILEDAAEEIERLRQEERIADLDSDGQFNRVAELEGVLLPLIEEILFRNPYRRTELYRLSVRAKDVIDKQGQMGKS